VRKRGKYYEAIMGLSVLAGSVLGTACGGGSVPQGTGKIPVVGHVFVL